MKEGREEGVGERKQGGKEGGREGWRKGGREGFYHGVHIPGFVAAIMSPGCPQICYVAEAG